MVKVAFIWQSTRDYGYGNQLNLGAVRRRCQRYERPLLFALAFNNVFDDREAAFKILNGHKRHIFTHVRSNINQFHTRDLHYRWVLLQLCSGRRL